MSVLRKTWVAAAAGLAVTLGGGSEAWAQVQLTFDDDGTVTNSEAIDQAYGDRVTASPDTNGLLYGPIAGGGAPNVEVSYQGLVPDLWTTGYGDLVNVLYNEADGDGLLQVTLVADAGFEVGLLGFDAAAFGDSLDVPGIDVADGSGNVLFASGPFTLLGAFTSGGTPSHNDFDFSGGLFAQEININVDLTGLGGASDNVGLDNIVFVQRVVPEPATAGLLALGGWAALAGRRRRD